MPGPSEGWSELPDTILALLDEKPAPVRAVVSPVQIAPSDKLRRASAYLAKIPGAVSGNGGHDQTWTAAQAMVIGFDMSEQEAFVLLSSEYNPKCDPPWSERELEHKVASAAKDSKLQRGYLLTERARPVAPAPVPAADDVGDPQVVRTRTWTEQLRYSAARNPTLLKTASNVAIILENDEAWTGVFGHNLLSDTTMLRKRPPFARPPHEHPSWNDTDDTRLQAWLEREYDVTIPVEAITRGVGMAARALAFHPVRDYLGALKWDGKPRIEGWLASTFGAESNAYTSTVGAKWLISACARIFDPGSKVDTVLVLEGDQGALKSTAILTLCGSQDWFLDELADVTNKDAAQQVSGRWIVEVAEMDSLSRSEWSGVKAFISRQVDRYRPAFGRHVVQQPRQCAFIGTINPGASGYLRDETGNRRFWPVVCPKRGDIEWLKANRDQLWAEAAARYQSGEVWHITDPTIQQAARAEQADRVPRDAWQEKLEHWLVGRDETSVGEVLEKLFNLGPEKWTKQLQGDVGRGIKAAGFDRTRLAVDSSGRRPWVYRRQRLLV